MKGNYSRRSTKFAIAILTFQYIAIFIFTEQVFLSNYTDGSVVYTFALDK